MGWPAAVLEGHQWWGGRVKVVSVWWHCWDGCGSGSRCVAAVQRPKRRGQRGEWGIGDGPNNQKEAANNMWWGWCMAIDATTDDAGALAKEDAAVVVHRDRYAAAAAAVEEVDDAVVMAADNATVDATTDNVAVRGD